MIRRQPMNPSDRPKETVKSPLAHSALWSAISIFIVTLISAFKLGTIEDAGRFYLTWVFPVAAGMISIMMGAFGIRQIVSNRFMTGYLSAISAMLIGIITPYVAWCFIVLGAMVLRGPLVYW